MKTIGFIGIGVMGAPMARNLVKGGFQLRVFDVNADASAVVGTLYLGVVITALGYAVWNWCLERLGAARMAAFVNVQPLAGALLGIWWLGEPVTPFLVVGGALIVAGLHLTVKPGRTE